MKKAYIEHKFAKKSLDLLEKIQSIVDEYDALGYDLTVRQCFYQLVARGFVENRQAVYKNIAKLISLGRLAGYIDWFAIVDRTRRVNYNYHYESIDEALKSAAAGYKIDLWEGQPCHVEVVVEKDALVEVVGKACRKLDCTFRSNRGYTSTSAVYWMSKKLSRINKEKLSFTLAIMTPAD